jgi:hypothetical protein
MKKDLPRAPYRVTLCLDKEDWASDFLLRSKETIKDNEWEFDTREEAEEFFKLLDAWVRNWHLDNLPVA